MLNAISNRFIGRGFDVVVGVPFGKTTREGLEKVAAEVVAATKIPYISGDKTIPETLDQRKFIAYL